MRYTLTTLLVAATMLSAHAQSEVHSATAREERTIALTFDDLPGVAMASGNCSEDGWHEFNQRMVASIVDSHVPALGLVTAGNVCDELRMQLLPRLLRAWLDADLELGNHSFSHRDLNDLPAEEFISDLDRTTELVRPLAQSYDADFKYFRYPYLHAGDEESTKREVEQALGIRGLTNAPVTIDNQEWVFARVYATAKRRGDDATMRRVGEAYVPYMESVVAFFEDYSVRLLGYELPQILLLHANELNADYLGSLVAMLRARGYALVDMDTAMRDPAYRRTDDYIGPAGISWLHRWAAAEGMETESEPREPEWMGELLRSY